MSHESAPQPQQPYYGEPPKKKHTLRNVLLVLALLFVLFVGGCIALIGGAANEVSKSIEESQSEVGGTDNPLEITPGEPFEVRGFEYAGGWTLGGDEFGNFATVEKLKVTNNREDRDGALVEIKLWRGSEVLAVIDCSTEQIAPESTTTLDCGSSDKMPKNYDKVTINDIF